MSVDLYAAIDIRLGKAVRLEQGDYDRETQFDEDPLKAAERWAADGARWLHVVDLDGAKAGLPMNLQYVRRIAETVSCAVQVGGGLRDEDAVAAALETGAKRAVIGTAAHSDPKFVGEMVDAHKDRIAVSVDTRGGMVSVSGWTRETEMPAAELMRKMGQVGVKTFTFTPVEADGMLEGPGLEALQEVAPAVKGELIYSGGVSSLDDLKKLAGLGLPNLIGVIVGRALYEGRFSVSEAQAALDGS